MFASACQRGDVAAVVALLAENRYDINARDIETGRTPLHYASARGDPGIVQLLLARGAHVHVQDKSGHTPLHVAAFAVESQVELTHHQFVLDQLRAHTEGDDTIFPLRDLYTMLEGHERVLRSLQAGRPQRWRVVEQLIQANAEPNAVDESTETPLHRACIGNDSEVARLLLSHGANLHAKNDCDQEPLHYCINRSGVLQATTLETIQVLVSFGASWDAKCDEMVLSGAACIDAPALRVCLRTWTQEHGDGRPFTHVPLAVVQRGAIHTQIYIDKFNAHPRS